MNTLKALVASHSKAIAGSLAAAATTALGAAGIVVPDGFAGVVTALVVSAIAVYFAPANA